MTMVKNLGVMILVGMLCGCASLKDFPKTIWGSTTRVLEEGRADALVKTYDKGYWDCFRAALSVVNKKRYVLYQKDEVRGLMVIMGIPGAVNTTEVGVFFVELNDHQTRIELSSLSSHAKRLLSQGLFHGMDIVFGYAPPDKDEGFSINEFQNGMTPEALIKTIEDDGFSVPSAVTPIDSLNAFLETPDFYEHWLIKYRSKELPQAAMDLVAVPDKNIDQIRRLNRLILEATYPSCPKSATLSAETKPSESAVNPK